MNNAQKHAAILDWKEHSFKTKQDVNLQLLVNVSPAPIHSNPAVTNVRRRTKKSPPVNVMETVAHPVTVSSVCMRKSAWSSAGRKEWFQIIKGHLDVELNVNVNVQEIVKMDV